MMSYEENQKLNLPLTRNRPGYKSGVACPNCKDVELLLYVGASTANVIDTSNRDGKKRTFCRKCGGIDFRIWPMKRSKGGIQFGPIDFTPDTFISQGHFEVSEPVRPPSWWIIIILFTIVFFAIVGIATITQLIYEWSKS